MPTSNAGCSDEETGQRWIVSPAPCFSMISTSSSSSLSVEQPLLQDTPSLSESVVRITSTTTTISETLSEGKEFAQQGSVCDALDDSTASSSITSVDYGTTTNTHNINQSHIQQVDAYDINNSTKKRCDWNYVYDEVV